MLRAQLFSLFAVAIFTGPIVAAPVFDYPKKPSDSTPIEKMRSGEFSASNAKNKELLGDLAKWHVHRLAHPPFNGEELKTKVFGTPDTIETLMIETERLFRWPDPRTPPNANQLEYAKILGQAMQYELLDLMEKTSVKLEKVNAARMLASTGRLPCEDLVPTYLKLIKDDKVGLEIKFFAFQGLRNLLLIPDPSEPAKHFIRDPIKLAEISTELSNYITKKPPDKLSSEQAMVVLFVRREAIRALAAFRVSVVRNQQAAILAIPIWALLRVATNDKIVAAKDAVATPAFGFQTLERLEAIIGICGMAPDKSLNLDLVVYLINEGLFEIASEMGKEKAAFVSDPRNKPVIPWRIMAARMSEAMKAWKASIEKLPATRNPTLVVRYVDDLIQKCLSKIEVDGVTASPDNRVLSNFRNNKPKSTQVIADEATTTVILN
ncbi:MAG: hypothetical protein K8T89_19315 [Planctomycetes bacterium]|nr:hypothetical protein [Planctomycetota bacterium]